MSRIHENKKVATPAEDPNIIQRNQAKKVGGLRVRKVSPVIKSTDVETFRRELLSGKRGGNHSYTLLLGMKKLELKKLIKEVQAGFPISAFERLRHNMSLPLSAFAELTQINKRTLARRREVGRLLPDESDRVLRISRVFGRALELFEGDERAAQRWLTSPQRAFGGVTPAEIAKTEVGSLEVERLIGRLEHGVFT